MLMPHFDLERAGEAPATKDLEHWQEYNSTVEHGKKKLPESRSTAVPRWRIVLYFCSAGKKKKKNSKHNEQRHHVLTFPLP